MLNATCSSFVSRPYISSSQWQIEGLEYGCWDDGLISFSQYVPHTFPPFHKILIVLCVCAICRTNPDAHQVHAVYFDRLYVVDIDSNVIIFLIWDHLLRFKSSRFVFSQPMATSATRFMSCNLSTRTYPWICCPEPPTAGNLDKKPRSRQSRGVGRGLSCNQRSKGTFCHDRVAQQKA